MAISKNINNLVINKVENEQVYEYMVQNNLINDDELYLIQDVDDEIKIDSSLSSTSENPVQNKIITEEIERINSKIEDTNISFTGEYSDIKNAPDILDDGSSSLQVVDPDGNIIMSINSGGCTTTSLEANDIILNNLSVTDTLESLDSNCNNLNSQLDILNRSLITETWTFTLDTGETVIKRVVTK